MLCVIWAEIDPSMYQPELTSNKSHRMRVKKKPFVPIFNNSSYTVLLSQKTLHVVIIQRTQILTYMYFFSKYKSKDAFLRENMVGIVYHSFEYTIQPGGKSIAF